MPYVKKVMTAYMFLSHAKALDVFSLYRFLVENKTPKAMLISYFCLLFFAILYIFVVGCNLSSIMPLK